MVSREGFEPSELQQVVSASFGFPHYQIYPGATMFIFSPLSFARGNLSASIASRPSSVMLAATGEITPPTMLHTFHSIV